MQHITIFNYVTLEIKAMLLTCTVAQESIEDVKLQNLHSMLNIQMTNIEEW